MLAADARPCRCAVWLAFAETLVLDDWAPAFTCTRCGQYPDTVVLDGTSLICQAKLIPPMRSLEGETLAVTGRYARHARARAPIVSMLR